MSESMNPLLDQNLALHQQYLEKEHEINHLNQEMSDLLHKKDFGEGDQAKVDELQKKIMQVQTEAQKIQQKTQSSWNIKVEPMIFNIQSASNMTGSTLDSLNRSRQEFLSTVR